VTTTKQILNIQTHSSEIHHCYVAVTTSTRCLRYATWIREEKRI